MHGDWHCLHSLHSSFLEKGLEADETGGFQMDDLSGWLSGALALFVTVSSWTCSLSVTSMNGVLSDWRNAFCRSWSQENLH